MHLSFFASCFIFASVVLADRLRKNHRTLNSVKQSAKAAAVSPADTEYAPNWSGAVLDKDNGTFTFATGTFTVPTPLGKSGEAASAWVGIDGHTCYGGGLLQAGVDFYVNDDGPSYDVWYEWFPDWSYTFDNISASAGDILRVNISAFSPTSGMATVENLSNGQHAAKTLNSTYELCRQNAEWIVEDFDDGNLNLMPFANFSRVTFADAIAGGPQGNFTPEEAIIVDIQQDGQTLTSVSANGTSLTITYV